MALKTVLGVLNSATDYLAKKGVAQARREAQEVIGYALDVAPLDLYINFERPLTEAELAKCRVVLSRRANREPTSYILEVVDFLDTKIRVSSDVLIPRQETENFVADLITQLKEEDLEGKVLWDLCTGSGCIAIALKKALPPLQVFGSDVSAAALQIAQENARLNEVDVTFLEGDLFEPFQGEQTNFLICNPPYVSEGEYEELEPEVKDYEPKEALVSGKTGLEFYQRFTSRYRDHLSPGGQVWLEMGAGQAPALQTLFGPSSTIIKDWAGHPRYLSVAN